MISKKFLITCLLAFCVAVAAAQIHSVSLAEIDVQSKFKVNQSNLDPLDNSVKRTARIMKILKDPKSHTATHVQRNWDSQKPQTRRDRLPPPGLQRPMPIIFHRSPVQPPYAGIRNQVHRRVHNGPPPNALLRTQHQRPQQQVLHFEQGKGSRFPLNGKEQNPLINAGKGAVFRPQFASGSHPNALPPQQTPQQQFHNFKPSPQYSGTAIVRPASDYPQYLKLLQDYMPYQDIKQHPLPQQYPKHQEQQQKFSELFDQNPSSNTAPQTFTAPQNQPGKIYTAPLLQSTGHSDATQKMYSVYEDPELNEHAPIQFNTKSQQNSILYNTAASENPPPMAAKEAEEYLKFMSTNEYFLPKLSPNYRKLDEVNDIQKNFKQKQKPQPQLQQLLYQSNSFPVADASGAATFEHPIEVSQLFYNLDATSDSAIVRGSYQAGNNAFVVKSDGNKAVKHVMSSPVVTQRTTTSSNAGSYAQFHFNPMRHHTPEPIHFEFTERDAVLGAHTNAPPSNGHLRYKAVNSASIPSQPDLLSSSIPSTTSVIHNRPISVNEVDTDPEDGDDMQDSSPSFYGRVPIRSSTENISGSPYSGSTTTTPATEQKDTEEYCERICSNVQDDDEEIVCGSDGYMYTGEAQMECYASCLHIDVTIQGKGSCSSR